MSKVDVIIPAYNSAHFLPGAIESVIAQTDPNWHMVIVDDGSTDNTRETVAPYLERWGERITYLYQENRGLPAARNAAIRASTSQFIALLDADDLWLPTRIAASLPLFEDQRIALTYSAVVRFREPGKPFDTFWENPGKGEGAVAREIYTRSIDLPCPTVTFRRSALAAVGMFDETMRATEDRDLWLRIAQRFRVGFIPEPTAWYRMSSGSMSADLPRMFRAQMQFIAKHSGENGCGWTARREALARVHRQHAEAYAERGERNVSMRHAWHAVALAPWQTHNLRTAVSLALRARQTR